MFLRTQRRRRSSGAGIVTGNTKGPTVQQIRNPFTARDAGFQVIPTRRVGEGEDQQEAHLNQTGPHIRLQLLHPPPHLLNPSMTTRRRNEKSEEESKDDLVRRRSLRMTRGTNAHPPKPHPPVEAGQTASHVAEQAERPRQRGKSVTQ